MKGKLLKRVYVAHPYNGNTANKDKVESIVKELVKEDPNVLYISPIHATGYLYNDVDYLTGMNYCFDLLDMCDELLLCEGWENSRGCNMEKQYAEQNGIQIKYR